MHRRSFIGGSELKEGSRRLAATAPSVARKTGNALMSWYRTSRHPRYRTCVAGMLCAFIALTGVSAAEGPAKTSRADHYDDALAQARSSGNDIVVFQRGSDWNRLGETLYQQIWQTPEFMRELGGGFVLVAVDRQEVVGDPPVPVVGQPLAPASSIREAEAVTEAQRIAQKNKSFSWWDTSICPRVALLDRHGRAVACENKPRLGLTPATLATRVKELRAIREKRDAVWAKAELAQGPARAELLRQGLEVMDIANWVGNDKCYALIHEQIRTADPTDDSGAVRWLTFGGDPRDGLKWAEPRWSKALEKKPLTDVDFEEALRRIDQELKDPRNRVLNHERLQRIMSAKYHVYRRWPKHEEQRFDVQRDIATLDPNTFWGIGARGDLGMNHRSSTPMLSYGWAARQMKPGLNVWDLTDTAYFFDHAGPYKIVLISQGGKDTVLVKRIALLDGITVLSQASPSAKLGPAHAAVAVDLELKSWSPVRKLTLRVEVEAGAQGADNSGRFAIEAQLPTPPVLAKNSARIDDTSVSLTRDPIGTVQDKLADSLLVDATTGRSDVVKLVATRDFQIRLMQHTLISLCGTGNVEDIRSRDGGERFLQALFADREWLESFLASDKAIWPASWSFALENLYLLHRYETAWEQPINQRIATALALQWAHYDRDWRYLLVERFRLIKQALNDGLMHRSFEQLSVREMRWAVLTIGRAKDFQFFLDDRQTRTKDYLGAHGAVRYLSNNVYGVSIHDGEVYVKPWWHAFGTNSLPIHRRVGGVCGALSNYGSAQATVHGIPSTTIGQPGHCAYVVRVGEEWPVGNSVTWPSDITLSGWDGSNYGTMDRLYEPMNRDRESFLTSTRLAWLAQLQAERGAVQVRVLPGLKYSLYQTGIGSGFPDFAKLTADRTGPCHVIDVSTIAPFPARAFASVWEGQLDVSGNGPLTVSVKSSGNSQVVIAGRKTASSSNRQLTKQELTLPPGRHHLRIEYQQSGGDPRLSVEFDGVLSANSSDWITTYEQAIAAQPINYVTWIDYLKLLEAMPDVPAAKWIALGQRAARTFAPYHEAGWALTRRCLDRALPTLKPAERVEILLACNQELRQENWFKPDLFPYDGILTWQANQIGDAGLATEFFGKLLTIHQSDKPDCNFIFGSILSWGAKRFAGRAETAAPYARAMDAFFKSKGKNLNRELLTSTLQSGIRTSGESGDVASFRLWTDLAQEMLPPLKPSDVHLTPKQAADFPKIEPFPGDLLSKDGMLHISSENPDDRPLSYRQLLSGGFGGWFDTKSDAKPWAQVQLLGDCELTGIVLVNRYEYPATHEAFLKSVPFDVLVSTDGMAWTKVATFSKAEMMFRVDLQGGKVKARYVRLERLPKPSESGPIERFYLRGFLVFGKRLY